MGIATLCIATEPFGFEDESRKTTATRAKAMIEEHVDSFCIVNLDELFQSTDHLLHNPRSLEARQLTLKR